MARVTIAPRWRKRFRGLLKEIDDQFGKCLRSGDCESIHALRVALRRARLLALAGRPVMGRSDSAAFRHWAFQLMEVLGSVRDADVTLEWLQRHAANGTAGRRIRARRVQLWRGARRPLRALSQAGFGELADDTSDRRCERKVERRFKETLRRFHARLLEDREQFDRLDLEGLHEFRRNLRRWRYLNETLLSRRELKSSRALACVVALQDALGEMQNREVIRQFLRSTSLPPAEVHALDRKLATQQRAWLEKARKRLGAVTRFRV